jgi:hypothetical protein
VRSERDDILRYTIYMKTLFVALLLLVPYISFAQSFGKAVLSFANIVDLLFPVAMAFAFGFFIWGLIEYILNWERNKEKAGMGRSIMIGATVSVVGFILLLLLARWTAGVFVM